MGEYAEMEIEREIQNIVECGNHFGKVKVSRKKFKPNAQHDPSERKKNYKFNYKALKDSSGIFSEESQAFYFRDEGKPKVDFYLACNKWRCKHKMFIGSGVDFLKWYDNQACS